MKKRSRGIEKMDLTSCVVIGVLAAISAAAIALALIRGTGTPRKKLMRSVLLLSAAALLCFGGEFMLSRMGMGWRCTPFNIMLFLCVILLVVTLWRCMNALTLLENTRSIFQACGLVSLVLVMGITLAYTAGYFCFLSWHDRVEPCDGQTIVYANDMHGGSGAHRYYAHINSLVHGEDLHIDFFEWSDHQLHGVPLPIADPPIPRITVRSVSETEDYATICAYDRQDGTVLWEYTTDRMETTELWHVGSIGLIGDGYIFTCNGSVICLDARTGQERWRNDDFGGAAPLYAVGGEIIYLCGIDGPDLFAISTEGETVKKIDTLYSGYHSPRNMTLSGDTLTIIMDGPGVDPVTGRPIQVNVSDQSITLIDYE